MDLDARSLVQKLSYQSILWWIDLLRRSQKLHYNIQKILSSETCLAYRQKLSSNR